jgi:bacteriorhodopsin
VLRQTILADWGMLATGAAERVLPAPWSYLFYVVSSLFFVQTLRGQYTLFAFGAQTLSTAGDLRALRALRKMTTLTWCLFPAARLACMAHVLGTNGEEVVFSLLDILAKFMFSTFLMVTMSNLAADRVPLPPVQDPHRTRLMSSALRADVALRCAQVGTFHLVNTDSKDNES